MQHEHTEPITIELIASRIGYSHTRTRSFIKELEAKGLLDPDTGNTVVKGGRPARVFTGKDLETVETILYLLARNRDEAITIKKLALQTGRSEPTIAFLIAALDAEEALEKIQFLDSSKGGRPPRIFSVADQTVIKARVISHFSRPAKVSLSA